MDLCTATPGTGVNPGLNLGVWLAEQEMVGRDKLSLVLSPQLVSFGLWLEQLIAESLSKAGRGLLPVLDDLSPGACAPGSPR